MAEGGCRCGAVRYRIRGDAIVHHALCHCRDCQHASGAPMVAWLAVPEDDFTHLAGAPVHYRGPSGSVRAFCGVCGTPLWFINAETLPGIVDIQSVTLDEPDAFVPEAQIQLADRRAWIDGMAQLPQFARYPGVE